MKLIGLAGLAGTGKDTIAARLLVTHGFSNIAFADPIRFALHGMFGNLLPRDAWFAPQKESPLVYADPFDHQANRLLPSPRRLMQLLGTEWGRDLINPDLWVMLAARTIATKRAELAVDRFVLTDVRMENEAEWIRSMGGHIWHVERLGAPTVARHSSENGVTRASHDFSVNNDCSIHTLHERVANYICREAGYSDPQPVSPVDRMTDLQQKFIESVRASDSLLARIERMKPELDRLERLAAAKGVTQ